MVGVAEEAGRNAVNAISGFWAKVQANPGVQNLIAGVKAHANQANPDPQPTYSYSRLVQLYTQFSQFTENDLVKDSSGNVVETVRQLTEALLWGEQNDSDFFSFFCEKSVLAEFVRVLGFANAPKATKVQLLQTLSMLVQNIRCQTSVSHLFDNSYLTELILMPLDFTDEEILAYYITLLKSFVMRLDRETVEYFFTPKPNSSTTSRFPLYIESTKFISNSDQMVRATVRTITLQVYKVTLHDEDMRKFVLRHASETYFAQLAHHLRDLWLRLHESVRACSVALSTGAPNDGSARAETAFDMQQDFLIYLSDIFELAVPGLNAILADRLLRLALVPVLVVGGLLPSNLELTPSMVSPELAMFLLRHIFDTFRCRELLEPLGSLLLVTKRPPATGRLLPKDLQAVDVIDVRGQFLEYLGGLDEETFFLAAAIVHSCFRNRKALPVSFLRAAQIFPPAPAKANQNASKFLKLLFNPFGACEARPMSSQEISDGEHVGLLFVMLKALEQYTMLEVETLRGLCRIVLDIVADPSVSEDHPFRTRAHFEVQNLFREAAHRLTKALETSKPEDVILDVLFEECSSPHITRVDGQLCSDLHCLLPREKPPPAEELEKHARFLVLSFLTFQQVLKDLIDLSPRQEEPALAIPLGYRGDHASSAFGPGLPNDFSEDGCFELGDIERIMCSIETPDGKSMRYFVLHNDWLLLAQPDLAAPGCVVVKLRWPLWQVQSFVDPSDPSTLSLFRRARPGEAVSADACRSPSAGGVSEKIVIGFDDAKRCSSAELHCTTRRSVARAQMRYKALGFVEGFVNHTTLTV